MATETRAAWEPQWSVHPGEVLVEALEERGISQAELARRTDRPIKTINEIAKGKAAITPDTALQLEVVLGIPARFWNNLQRDFWEAEARAASDRRLVDDADWVKRFPLAAMRSLGWIRSTGPKSEQLAELLRFFAVSSPVAWEKNWSNAQAAFRRSPAFTPSPYAVAAWLRRGELQAADIPAAPYDAAALRSHLSELRRLVTLDPLAFMPELRGTLAAYGVILVLTKELPRTHLSGATRWVAGRPVVQLSMRHKSDDQFWWAFFHEIGHVLQGGPRSAYLDGIEPDAIKGEDEEAADRFAASQLIPAVDYERIRRMKPFDTAQIQHLGADLGVPPGILLGRLQREGLVGPGEFNYLKRFWKWGDER